jgi:zinc protease
MPILGNKESLDRISGRSLEEYHGRFYVPENVIVVISGDVDPDSAFDLVEKYFGRIEQKQSDGWSAIEAQKPSGKIEAVAHKDVKQVYLAMGFLTRGFVQDRKNIVALDIAAALLGEGRSSRLHQELVEKKKLAISIGAWNWDMRLAGAFWIDAILKPDKIEEATNAIVKELDLFLNKGMSKWEMRKVKSMIKSDQLYDLQSNASIAGLLGFYQTDFDDAEKALSYLDLVETVSIKNVNEAFTGVYDPDNYVKTMILPSEGGGM